MCKDLEIFGIPLKIIKDQPIIVITSTSRNLIIGRHPTIFGVKYENGKYTIVHTALFINNSEKIVRLEPEFCAINLDYAKQTGGHHVFVSVDSNLTIQLRNYYKDAKQVQNFCADNLPSLKKYQDDLKNLQPSFDPTTAINDPNTLLEEIISNNHLDDPLISGIFGWKIFNALNTAKTTDDKNKIIKDINGKIFALTSEEKTQLCDIITIRHLICELTNLDSDDYDSIIKECIDFLNAKLQQQINNETNKENKQNLINEQQALIGPPNKTAFVFTRTATITEPSINKSIDDQNDELYKQIKFAEHYIGHTSFHNKHAVYIPASKKEFDGILSIAQREGQNPTDKSDNSQKQNFTGKPYNSLGNSKFGFFYPGINCINYAKELLQIIFKSKKNSKDWYDIGNQFFNSLHRVEIFKTIINQYTKQKIGTTTEFNELLKEIESFFERFCSITDIEFNPKLHLTPEEYKECYKYAEQHLSFTKEQLNQEQKKLFQTNKPTLHETFYEKLESVYKNQVENLPTLKTLLMI